MKKQTIFLMLVVLLSGCNSSKNLTTEVQRSLAKFDYVPPSRALVGSADMTIALVKPVFINENPEYLVSPFPEMATSMGNDLEELLTAKGFTIKGPFGSRDEMVYSEKINSSFILQIQIDLNPYYETKLTKHTKTTYTSLMYGSQYADVSYSAYGTITLGGNLILTALSPQYGEKLWKKNIALDETSFSYEGTKRYDGNPNMAVQLKYDNQVYNTLSRELEKIYSSALGLVWRQIDTQEMKIVAKQAKEADGRND